MTSKRQNRHPDIMHESRLTPRQHVRQQFLAPVGFMEIPVGNARKTFIFALQNSALSLFLENS